MSPHVKVLCENCRLLRDALFDLTLIVADQVGSGCLACDGEGGWTDDTPHARMIPVRHKNGCALEAARAALAAARPAGKASEDQEETR